MEKIFLTVVRWLAAYLLNLIPRDQPHGTRLFEALCGHIWFVSFEGVLLRRGADGRVEVYLTRRAQNETFPGQHHCPGTIFGSFDSGPKDAAKRLGTREYGAEITAFRNVGCFYNPDEGRGRCLHMVHLVRVSEPKGGSWHPVDDLPLVTVQSHRSHAIPIAVAAYQEENQ